MRFPITCTVSHKWPHSHGALGHGSPASLQVHNNSNWAHSWTQRGARIRGVTESVSPTYTHTHTHTHTHTRRRLGSWRPTSKVRETLMTQSNIFKITHNSVHTTDRNTPARENVQGSVCVCVLTCSPVWQWFITYRNSALYREKKCIHIPSACTQKIQKAAAAHTHTNTRAHTHTHTRIASRLKNSAVISFKKGNSHSHKLH